MPTHIALLRGINVGGKASVPMAALRTMFADLGFADAKTLLQSGNVVFTGKGKTPAALERLLEAEAKQRFGWHIDFFVRSASEWRKIIEANPFAAEAKRDPGHLVVVCFKDKPAVAAAKALQAAIKGRETFRIAGRHAYVVYPDGIGRSKFTLGLIEKTLDTRGTGRNWNTVLKLAELMEG
jgi:uncharacterized protein (DUF1697 family)